MGNYSWGAYSTLPTDDADLSNILDAAALSQIASDDTVRLAQPADGMISIIQFKDTITAGSATVRWNGQSNVAPSTAAVNLEIYNRSGTPAWESLTSDNTTAADTDLTLSSYISDLTDYKNVNDIACRVYQAASAGITYLLNDTFTTDRAAGAVNGTAPEPGPGGNRVVTSDTSYISSGRADFKDAYQAGWVGWSYSDLSARTLGTIMKANIKFEFGDLRGGVGYSISGTDNRFKFGPTVLAVATHAPGQETTIGSNLTGDAEVAIVFRAWGNFWFVKRAGASYWTLAYLEASSTGTPVGPGYKYQSFGTSSTDKMSSDYIKIADPASYSWYPYPIASDGFSGTFPAMDGEGHYRSTDVNDAAIRNSGEGAHGALTWTQLSGGTISNSGGYASATAAGGAVVNVGKSDVIVSGMVGAGTTALIVRSDGTASNCLKAYHDGTAAKLDQIVGGSPTNVISQNVATSSWAFLTVMAIGDQVTLVYNNIMIDTPKTCSTGDTNTYCGFWLPDNVVNIGDWHAYSAGTAGEHDSGLDGV